MTPQPFVSERDEIAKIDYLLDHLARAVERGEVHRSSYDLLAPRYLERRAELIAVVTGANRARSAATSVRPAPEVGGATTPPSLAVAAPSSPAGGVSGPPGSPVGEPGVAGSVLSQAPPARESRPVKWTTVLTFLGAFLVIAAAAIFAVVVWDIIGVVGKLVFMGTLTCVFYIAGWYARQVSLKTGAIALTTVASAMLLFDGWIFIDGFGLEGPLPWAVLLLACSAVYWATEVALADRFFGVVGAAAQLGWWWLLGAGLGLAVPARLAGMAVIALVWQLASERGRGDRTFGSLATVLEWSSPIVAVGLALGVVVDLVRIGSAGPSEVLAAATVCASAGAVLHRTRLLSAEAGHWVVAAAQMPLFASVLVAWGSTGATWGLVVVVAVMAASYDVMALVSEGVPLAVLGLASEFALVVMVCDVLDVSPRVTVCAMAGLAVLWAIGARIAESPASADGPLARASEVRAVADTGSMLLLAVSAAASIVAAEGIALAGFSLTQQDTIVVFFVLASWWLVAAVRRHGAFAFGACVWSLYALAALMSWLLPAQRAEFYAIGLVALAGAWIATAGRFAARYGREWRVAIRVAGSVSVSVFALAGLVLGVSRGWEVTWWSCVLELAAALVFAIDAVAARSRVSSGLAGAFAVLGAALGGMALGSEAVSPEPGEWWAQGAASAGAVITGVMAALGARARRLAEPAALAAVVTATLLALPTLDQHGLTQNTLAMLAVAWGLAAFVSSQWLMIGCGISAFGISVAFVAYGGYQPAVAVLVPGLTGLALGVFGMTRPGGPGGRLAQSGISLAIAGLLGQAMMVALGIAGAAFDVDAWYAVGPWGLAAATAVLGAHAIAQSARWRVEPGYYAGGFAVLASVWFAFGAAETTVAEAYSTPLAIYLIVCGHVSSLQRPDRPYPVVFDGFAVGVGLGYPLLLGLFAPVGAAGAHALWVLGLSLIAIAGGVLVKSRWYFFGGVGALAAIAGYRSFVVLAEFWWVLLGVVGIAMLVIALTWERQRLLVSETRERMRRSFQGWR